MHTDSPHTPIPPSDIQHHSSHTMMLHSYHTMCHSQAIHCCMCMCSAHTMYHPCRNQCCMWHILPLHGCCMVLLPRHHQPSIHIHSVYILHHRSPHGAQRGSSRTQKHHQQYRMHHSQAIHSHRHMYSACTLRSLRDSQHRSSHTHSHHRQHN